jgi:hypothetical protein
MLFRVCRTTNSTGTFSTSPMPPVDLRSMYTHSTNISTQLTYIYILSHSQTWQGDIVAEYGGRNLSQLKDGEQKAMDTLKMVYPEVHTEYTRHFRALSDIDGESH